MAPLRTGLLPLLLVACSPKVPEHLRLEPKPTVGASVEIVDLSTALGAIVGKDPLARSPGLPDPAALQALEGGAPLAAFVRQIRAVEQGEGPVERLLQQLEDEHRESAVVALSRGYRLRLAENQLANTLVPPEERQRSVIALITPLNAGIEDPTLGRGPMDWLSEAGGDAAVRTYAERWTLDGWLAHPAIPVPALAPALAGPQYDGLRASPTGRLLMARVEGRTGEAEPGLADLRRATALALQRAAADRDREQAAWSEARDAAAADLGAEEPIPFLLNRSLDALIAAAADDRAAGGALLALAALRWEDRCGLPPCVGLDRVETMAMAARWDPEIAALAGTWQVVALKEAVDSMEVGHDTALFPNAMLALADALIGTGGGPLDVQLLRKRRPDAQVWLTLARAVGDEGITDWEGVRIALGRHLLREAQRSTGLVADEGSRALLERIGSRAVP